MIDGSGILPNATTSRAPRVFYKGDRGGRVARAATIAKQRKPPMRDVLPRAYIGTSGRKPSARDAGQVPIAFVYNMPYFNIGKR